MKKVGIVILILFIGGLIFGISRIIQNPEQYQRQQLSPLRQEMNLTAEQEAAMLQIFNQCRIGEISEVKAFQSGDNHTSYHLTDNEVSEIVVWVSSTGEVESIYFQENDIFENGKLINPITKFYVNSKDKDAYRTSAQSVIKKLLNNPDTASFPGISKWKFTIEDNIVIVQSSVTAENSFGVEDTFDFQIKYEDKRIISIIMDGTEYI